jgi:hypothetical protein
MRFGWLLLALMVALTACTGGVTGVPDPGRGGAGGQRPPGQPTGGTPGTPPGMGGAGGNPGPNPTPPDPGPIGAPPTTSAVPDCKGEETTGPRRLRLLTRAEYANSVADLLFIQAPALDNLPVESVVDGFDNNARAAVVTNRHVDEYLTTSERLATTAIMQSRWRLATCAAGNGCDRTFVTGFGRRAFRRPLTADEERRYLLLFDAQVTGGVFEKGMELVLRAMLASPNFLYRSEVGERAPDGTYKLTGYEVATALSYLLWQTTPDDMLLEAARTGGLDQPAGIETQARRLLADRRARPAVGAFFRQWLGTDGFLFTNKDAAVYPRFSDAVRKAMIAEQDAFVSNVVFDGTGAFAELFTAEYVFADATLAGFYGLPAGGATPARTAVPGGAQRTRGGLLTLGAVLGAHAHSNESSPVRRGLFVRTRLLCQSLPPPPPNVDVTPPGLDPRLTTRDRFGRHTSEALCRTCHRLIDDVGFGFEQYDGVGAHRPMENGLPVDASGEVVGLEALTSDAVTKFVGPVQLGALVAASPNAQACLARQLFRYARGGENGDADACAIKKLQGLFTAGGLDIRKLLIEVVKQKSFVTRS